MGKYAYIRVSSNDQNELRQELEMKSLSIPPKHIYKDKASGMSFNRDAYLDLKKVVKKGDIIYISSLDRLGRNYDEIKREWYYLTQEKKVDLCILDMPLLDTRGEKDLMKRFISDIVLEILSFVAQQEKINIHQRQAQGIAAAKIKGIQFGRPKLVKPDQFKQLKKDYRDGKKTVIEIADICRVSKSTIYRWIKTSEHKLN